MTAEYVPPGGWKAEAEAWRDNYDGVFQRWAECDAERVALKAEVEALRLRLRLFEQGGVTKGTV